MPTSYTSVVDSCQGIQNRNRPVPTPLAHFPPRAFSAPVRPVSFPSAQTRTISRLPRPAPRHYIEIHTAPSARGKFL